MRSAGRARNVRRRNVLQDFRPRAARSFSSPLPPRSAAKRRGGVGGGGLFLAAITPHPGVFDADPPHRSQALAGGGKGGAIQFRNRHHDTSLSSGALMQRDQCAGLNATIGGGAARQGSLTKGQRAAKRQPAGSLVIFGTMPWMVARCEARRSSRGIEPSRPTV